MFACETSPPKSPLISDLQLGLPVHSHLSTVLDFHVFGRPELKTCHARLQTSKAIPHHLKASLEVARRSTPLQLKGTSRRASSRVDPDKARMPWKLKQGRSQQTLADSRLHEGRAMSHTSRF